MKMQNITKTLIFLITSIIGFSSFGQKPENDAIYQSIIEEFTFMEDGSVDHHYYKKMKYLTHASFNRYFGETFIIYNPEFQSLKINKSQTIQENGNLILTPENAFNEVLPAFAKNAPPFNHFKEMVITHTGLEINAVAELDYSIFSDANYMQASSTEIKLLQNVPVEEYIVRITLPLNQKLYYRVLNIRTAPQLIEQENSITYEFKFSGLPAEHSEIKKPNAESFAPMLRFSTFNQEDFYNKLIKKSAFQMKPCKAFDQSIAQLKEETKNELELILAIQTMLIEETNTYHIPTAYSLDKVLPATEVYKNNGATLLEKAILFSSVFRTAGINAYPAFVLPGSAEADEVFSPGMVKGILVQVNPRESEQLLLSVDHQDEQNQLYTLGSQKLLVLNPDKDYQLFENKQEINQAEVTIDLVYTDSLTLKGSADLEFQALPNPWFSLSTNSEHAKNLLSGSINQKDVTSAEVVMSTQSKSKIHLDLMIEKTPEELNAYYFIDIPSIKNGTDGWHINYLPDERYHPLEIPIPLKETFNYSISLPETFSWVNEPETILINSEIGNLKIELSIDGKKLTLKRSIEINDQNIKVNHYEDFKSMIDTWNLKKYRKLIFKATS